MVFKLIAALSCIWGSYLGFGLQLDQTSAAEVKEDSFLCDGARHLSFDKAGFIENDFGTVTLQGSRKPRSIKYSNVLPESHLSVDMIVTAVTPYFGNPDFNSVAGDFAVINVEAGADVELEIGFVDRVSGEPVTLPPFYFTVANLGRFDDDARPGGEKSFYAPGFLESHTFDGSHITAMEDQASGSTRFSSSFVGQLHDEEQAPPTRARQMRRAALENSVTLLYPATSSFQVVLSVEEGIGSRDFYFTGSTNLVCPALATCGSMTCPPHFLPRISKHDQYCAGEFCTFDEDIRLCCRPHTQQGCDPTNAVNFSRQNVVYNNLGGLGPDGLGLGVRFQNVLEGTDMVVTNASSYTPGPGAHSFFGDLFTVDIAPESSVALTFAFIDSYDKPVELKSPLHVGIYDLGATGDSVEEVEANGFSSYTLAENSTIHADLLSDSVLLTGAAMPEFFDKNMPPEEQLAESVTLKFSPGISQFQLIFRVRGGSTGGRVMLDGWGATACPPLSAFCSALSCPAGFNHRDDPSLLCAGPECTAEDISECCDVQEDMPCGKGQRMQFIKDALVHNNLGFRGPGLHSPGTIRIADIFPESSSKVEMRVTVVGNYKIAGTPPQNELLGGFLKIDVRNRSKVVLNFDLFDMETNMLRASDFHLTVGSFDQSESSKPISHVFASGFTLYNLSADTSVKAESHIDAWGVEGTMFTMTKLEGSERQFPSSTLALSRRQMKRSVSFKYSNTASFQLTLLVSEASEGYRSFFIGGTTGLACPVDFALCNTMVCPANSRLKPSAAALACNGPICSEDDVGICCANVSATLCDAPTSVVLDPSNLVYSNLGGFGPDTGTEQKLLYANVMPSKADAVDLEVFNKTLYLPSAVVGNGMHGAFGSISLAAGSNTTFGFRFLDRATGKPVSDGDLGDYYLSFVDLQALLNHRTGSIEGRPQLKVPEAKSYILSDRSHVKFDGSAFIGHSFGAVSHSPRHPWGMDVRHMHTSVTLQMNASVLNIMLAVGESDRTLPWAAQQ